MRMILPETSHPSRVRGLKLFGLGCGLNRSESHPSRVRGLKHKKKTGTLTITKVAPFTGAWIETLIIGLIY